MLRWVAALLLGAPAASFVLQTGPAVAPRSSALAIRRSSAVVCAEWKDEEGNSVQEMSTDAPVRFSDLAKGSVEAKLAPDMAALLVLKKSGMTDLDYDIACASTTDTELDIAVRPMMNTYEKFVCGLTADSHPSFKMTSEFEGTMSRRGGEPTVVSIKCEPNGASGELVAYLCFILVEEKAFSTYYKITCTSR